MPQLTAELILRAYSLGIFPMANGRDDTIIHWVDPKRRGVIGLDQFHISKSLRKTMRRGGFWVMVDHDFSGVMRNCAARSETWINDEIHKAYQDLHQMGYAHSIEVYDDTGMVGGVYGVALGAAFFGESMFSTRTDMSKIALAQLFARLKVGGFTLFDTQFLTDHLASVGGVEISRAQFRKELADAIKKPAIFTP